MAEPNDSKPVLKLPQDVGLAMSAERTFLSWIRTGLAMMGFGFVVARFGLFLRELAAVQKTDIRLGTGESIWIGTALVFLGVIVCVASTVDHFRTMRSIARGRVISASVSVLAVTVAILLAFIGAGMAAYLMYLRN